ncbi:MAG: hypothetical protein OEW04_10065, partial [Nitrospirota bacterium]|nr:hypothetical protein [Nitrospirota bacterium]
MPKGKTLWSGIIGIMILLASAGISSSAVSYTSLPPITSGLKAPDDVAVAPDGKIYVVDGYQDRIFIYDRNGTSLGTLLIENPTSVAINTDGTIYIASNYDLSVKILNPSGEVTGSLGKGKDEFRLPMNITIDKTTGNVLVVDQLDESIKIYSSDGTYLRKINDLKNQPRDVAVLDKELYVLDHPRIIDYMGGLTRGARVQVFGMDGYPLSDYGYDDTANKNRNLALGFLATSVAPLEGPQRFGITADGTWTGTREVIRVYTGVYGRYYRSIAANAKTHITVYMSQSGTSAGVYAQLCEYNDATGVVGVKGTTLVQKIEQANGDAQEFDLTFNNAAFIVAMGNRLVVRYYFQSENSAPALLFGSVYSATVPAGPTYFTLNESTINRNYYIWNSPAANVGVDGTTNITQLASRSFGSYGLNVGNGEMVRPAGIAGDAGGALYITDAYHGLVMGFNGATGTYLGAVQDTSLPMAVPKGIALGADKRLFAASMGTSRVNVFGLEGYVSMAVAPSSLTFEGKQGMENPTEQSLTVSNSGTGILTYTAASASGWIVLTQKAGSVGPGSSVTIPVGVDITGLAPATYHGTIVVTDTVSGVNEDISVSLVVKAVPVLSVSPGSLSYTCLLGGAVPAPKTVTINLSNDPAGTTAWTAVPDAGWLSIVPSGMTGNGITTANVTVQPYGLVPATYTGHISIIAPGATGS